MFGKTLKETLVAFALTLFLTVLGAGMLSVGGSPSVATAFFVDAPRAVLVFLGVGLLLWLGLILLANFFHRERSPLARLLTNFAAALLVALLVVVSWAALAQQAGGVADLLAAVAFGNAMVFVAAALIGLALTHLLIFGIRRRLPDVGPATQPMAGP